MEENPEPTTPDVEPPDAAAGEQPDDTEKKPQPGPTSAQDDAEPADIGVDEIRASQVVYNYIRSVTTDSATFGVTGRDTRRATGKIDQEDLDAALKWYVPPAPLDQARKILERRHLVVLVGAEGIGKRTTALWLLAQRRAREPSQPAITSLSPATPLMQLATAVKFRRGGCYLVRDHVGGSAELSTCAHDIEVLAGNLRQAGAYLVITTTSAALSSRHLPDLVVPMRPPDGVALLDRCLESVIVDEALRARACTHAAQMRCPRDIVELARRLASRPDGAFDALDSTARDQVTAWADGEVTRRDVLSVATLALVGAQPEPTFEALLAMVTRHAEPEQEERDAAPYLPPERDLMPKRQRDHELITVVTGEEPAGPGDGHAGRVVRFRTRECRETALEILHDRFGRPLWEPVHRWLAELSKLDLKPEIRGELAYGLARLARSDFIEIRTCYLQPWSNGVASERSTAAMVLWFMSEDDRLASLALHTAMDWGHDNGLHRAITSAIALGGPLGLRFPAEAMRRLCFLALRAKRIGVVARLSLAFLFATAAVDGEASAGEVLTRVRRELDNALHSSRPGASRRATGAEEDPADDPVADPYLDEQLSKRRDGHSESNDGFDDGREQYERGWNYRVVLAARHLVVAVLGAQQNGSDEPVAALVLRSQPANVPELGRLWADVLCSAPHRAGAIDALRRTLHALRHDASVGHAVARLGAAVDAAMPAAHKRIRIPELKAALADGRSNPQPPQMLVSTLLAAFEGSMVRARPVPARSL